MNELRDDTDTMRMLSLLKSCLWGSEPPSDIDREVYLGFCSQAITALPASIMPKLSMPDEIRDAWQKNIIRLVAFYVSYSYEQEHLPLTVPYVILKGTSAAQYYPHPEYRTMGDIDIITRREDFDAAYNQLLVNGFRKMSELEREVSFWKNGVTIELHRYFASLNDPVQSKYLDDLIIQNINSSHVLPDPVNGLVLLEHISQHLEKGLGLRQIIDWMMFVHRCLPDQEWPSFRQMANQIGMETLAVTVTRMCEMYLGLPERQWSKGANEKVCAQLMEFILSSGNFGVKLTSDADVGETILTYSWGPVAAFKYLQERGLENWKITRRVACLRPFAWLYQAGRYLFKGFSQDEALITLKKQYKGAKKRKRLMDSLAVKQKSKGLVVYKNGKYVKE